MASNLDQFEGSGTGGLYLYRMCVGTYSFRMMKHSVWVFMNDHLDDH